MHPEISAHQKRDKHFDFLNQSFPERINIYEYAILEQNSKISSIATPEKNKFQLGVIFRIDGEVKGYAISLLEIGKKELSKDDLFKIQSLHIESINILFGNVLTKLEEISNIMGILSSPHALQLTDPLPQLFSHYVPHNRLKINYVLKNTNNEKYDCSIYLLTDVSEIHEV